MKKDKKQQYLFQLKNMKNLQKDIYNLTIIAKRRDESTITLEELKYRLKKDEFL
jgi:hypothetical protein